MIIIINDSHNSPVVINSNWSLQEGRLSEGRDIKITYLQYSHGNYTVEIPIYAGIRTVISHIKASKNNIVDLTCFKVSR